MKITFEEEYSKGRSAFGNSISLDSMKLILVTSSRFSPVEIVEFENVTFLLVANRASVQSVAEPPLIEWTSDLDC